MRESRARGVRWRQLKEEELASTGKRGSEGEGGLGSEGEGGLGPTDEEFSGWKGREGLDGLLGKEGTRSCVRARQARVTEQGIQGM